MMTEEMNVDAAVNTSTLGLLEVLGASSGIGSPFTPQRRSSDSRRRVRNVGRSIAVQFRHPFENGRVNLGILRHGSALPGVEDPPCGVASVGVLDGLGQVFRDPPEPTK